MKILIETERLLLREITLDDKEELFKLHSNPEVQKYTGEPVVASIEEMEEAIRTRIEDHKTYGYGRWATFSKGRDAFCRLGWLSLSTRI